MCPLAASEMLTLWEQGLSQTALERMLTLVGAVLPGLSAEQVGRLPIGQRDRVLLRLREQLFGSQLVSVTQCPVCGDRLEMAFSIQEICLPLPAEVPQIVEVQQDGYHIKVRLPTSLDLAAIAQMPTQEVAALRHTLLERCVLEAQQAEEPIETAALPEAVIGAIAHQLWAADPQADIQLHLICPACSHEWQMTFEIGSYLWSELHAWAMRVLQEVHLLASAYGWSEADILAMTPRRRQFYLDLIGST